MLMAQRSPALAKSLGTPFFWIPRTRTLTPRGVTVTRSPTRIS